MNVSEKINTLIAEYNEKVNQLTERINTTGQRIAENKLVARFIREKELPEASVKRVLEGDTALEAKLKKKLEKLETELLEKQEELLILTNALKRYKLQSSEELKQYQELFNDDRAIAKEKAYSKMMTKKREYIVAMQEEAEALHEFQAIDVKMQEIELEAGLRNGIFNTFTVDSAPIPSHLNRHSGVYLALTHEEVQKIIKKGIQPSELAYLDKFKHKSAL